MRSRRSGRRRPSRGSRETLSRRGRTWAVRGSDDHRHPVGRARHRHAARLSGGALPSRVPPADPNGHRDRNHPRRPHGRQAAVRRRLLQARAGGADDALRPKRRRQVDPAAAARRRARPGLGQPRLQKGARVALHDQRPPRESRSRSASTSSPAAPRCWRPRPSWSGWRRRCPRASADEETMNAYAAAQQRLEPAAATAGATTSSPSCAASASAPSRPSARSRPSPAAS